MNKLRILSPDPLLPEKFGGYIRTINIAKLLSNIFQKIEIRAVHEKFCFDGYIDSIYIRQNKKFKSFIDKYQFILNAFLSKNLVIPEKSFDDLDEFLFQIESPYFFNALKKKKITQFILNEHNVNWELSSFHYNDPRTDIYNIVFGKRNKNVEIEALKAAALILVCSDADKKKILTELPDLKSNTITIPNCINFHDYQTYANKEIVSNSGRSQRIIMFVGTLDYLPNRDAVNIISYKIAPHFSSDVQFQIIGKNPPSIRTPDNVHFLGYIDDVKQAIHQSDVCIAPIRFGSGTRLKILEYMAMKKPVISTSKGAEGLEVRNGEHIILEDNLDLFAKQISSLLDDEKKMRVLGEGGQKLVKEKYDWKLYRGRLEREYRKLI